ncbi:MAG: hypothetical protein ACI9YU_001845 [Flavobacteriales bacterium]|jgi:hypothetical protein
MKKQVENTKVDLSTLEFGGWRNDGFTFGINPENNKGVFKGKVISEEGARVFGVIVEIVGTGKTYITSPSGYFKINDVPEGFYLVRFTYPGFKEAEAIVSIFGGEELDLTMEFSVAA